MTDFIPGQRWISEAELQQGLGTVLDCDERTVTVLFMATGETRTYARQSAPLRRVRFAPGDTVRSHEGWEMTVTGVREQAGLLRYAGARDDGQTVWLDESALDSFTRLNQPLQRLLGGQIDHDRWFCLRAETMRLRAQRWRSPLYGLTGGRTSLIPHQLYIAHEVARRHAPRVLLADEVGLGKTIEAGMILHQRLLTGRARRVLVVVPDSLVHQWLVEMRRRFNLAFSILDAERCAAIDDSSGMDNPFEAEQLVISPLSLLVDDETRFDQALAAAWDLLVVDEAHHLQWTPAHSSRAYDCIEALARRVAGVLLLTATPEQLGRSSHFARLRLLDPDRFHDYQAFLAEEAGYARIADAAARLLDDHALDQAACDALAAVIEDSDSRALLARIAAGDDGCRGQLIEQLLDRHGTGRILFRNTRQSVSGFPRRRLHATGLPLPDEYAVTLRAQQDRGRPRMRMLLCPERLFEADGNCQPGAWLDFDPRVAWLHDTLRRLRPERVLVITASKETALDLSTWLRLRTGIGTTVFHEGMTLVERDRAAAWFADPEDGCQALVCSEIGSEGRNFQFAHHLVLFDLPFHPDLLEQRIGRLDRIGQRHDVEIHVPYLQNSPQEILMRWYHEGLNAFESPCHAGFEIHARLETTLADALHQYEEGLDDIDTLLATTQRLREEMDEALERGRDRLLELNACRPGVAEALTGQALREDRSSALPAYLERLFDAFGVDSEPHGPHSLVIHPGEAAQTGALPGLGDDGMTVTCDRDTALANEDMQFLTWEHPLVSGAMEAILGNETGNTSMITLQRPGLRAGLLLTECLFVLEPPATLALQTTRYLPPSGIRIVIDHELRDHASNLTPQAIAETAQSLPADTCARVIEAYGERIRALVDEAEARARARVPALLETARREAIADTGAEIERLRALARVNPGVRAEEITHFERLQSQLVEAIDQTRLRLDALRVMVSVA